MTISTAASPLSYAGDDATVAFAITWAYQAKSHVVATLRDSAGAETTQTLTTHYTLTAAGATGTLTMITAPATGETLVITSEPPNTQETDIPLGGAFPAPSVEDSLDLASQVSAKIDAKFDRALRVPKTDTRSGSQLELPNETDRLSKYLGFDANGDPAALSAPTDTSVTTTYSATLLAASSANQARGILQSLNTLGTVAGTNTITAVADAVITAYATNSTFMLTPAATNTGATTINIDTVGAKNLFNQGAALIGGELVISVPVIIQYDGTQFNVLGTIPLHQKLTKGGDIASASPFVIDTDGDYFIGTGVTGFSAFTVAANRHFFIEFSGVLTMTHGAGTLDLPGAANITTADGDVGEFVSTAANVVTCVNYTNVDGKAVVETGITLGTEQASTSGTSIDFTGIPSGCKKITVMFDEVSTNGTSDLIVQIGDSGGIETGTYLQAAARMTATANTVTNFTTGFTVADTPSVAGTFSGVCILSLEDSANFTWTAFGSVALTGGTVITLMTGVRSISAELTQVRISTTGGSDTFDAGAINIQYS